MRYLTTRYCYAPRRKVVESMGYAGRPYDCCTTCTTYLDPCDSPQRSTTYGSYIYPITVEEEARRPRTYYKHTADCGCDCCPHGADVKPKHKKSKPKPKPKPERIYTRRTSSTIWLERCDDDDDDDAGDDYDDDEEDEEDYRVDVDIVDKTSAGTLRRRYGKRFLVSLRRSAGAKRLLKFVNPSHSQKVVVRWADGTTEPLDTLIPLGEIARDADKIEITDRKRVHWRH